MSATAKVNMAMSNYIDHISRSGISFRGMNGERKELGL